MASADPSKSPSFVERSKTALNMEVAGDKAASRGDDREALSCWAEALEILSGRARPAEAARVASKMAMTEESLGETQAAGAHYAQAADLYTLAGDKPRVPMCLNNLAMLHKVSGNLEEAAVLLGRALDEASRCHGSAHGETALIAGAEQRHMQALAMREQLFGPSHPEVGLSLGHLAVIHQMRGEREKARSFYTSALVILNEFPALHEAERAILQENLEGI